MEEEEVEHAGANGVAAVVEPLVTAGAGVGGVVVVCGPVVDR